MSNEDIRPDEAGMSGWEIMAKRAAEQQAAADDAKFWRGVFGFEAPEQDNRFATYMPWHL